MVSTRIKPCKVLIVDNEPFVVEELVDLFENNDINCIGCVSSTEALTRFHDDEHVGVVLSDYRMPEMNGIELIHQLKKTAGKRPFESILFTGDADKEDVIAALRAGVSDYHQKPLDLDALLAVVQRLQRRVQRRAAAVGVELIGERIGQMAESLQELQQGVSGLPAEAETESVPVVELPGYSKLSPRQMEVAELLARGLTNYQISCELGISENTVKLYVSQVLRATNMHNRTMLALALGARKYPRLETDRRTPAHYGLASCILRESGNVYAKQRQGGDDGLLAIIGSLQTYVQLIAGCMRRGIRHQPIVSQRPSCHVRQSDPASVLRRSRAAPLDPARRQPAGLYHFMYLTVDPSDIGSRLRGRTDPHGRPRRLGTDLFEAQRQEKGQAVADDGVNQGEEDQKKHGELDGHGATLMPPAGPSKVVSAHRTSLGAPQLMLCTVTSVRLSSSPSRSSSSGDRIYSPITLSSPSSRSISGSRMVASKGCTTLPSRPPSSEPRKPLRASDCSESISLPRAQAAP